VKIALAQINPTVGDFAGNTGKILEYSTRAQQAGATLVMFPELSICGYPPGDFLEKKDFVSRAAAAVDEIAAWTGEQGRPAILCGTVMPTDAAVGKQVRNVAVLLAHGRISFVQQKMLLPFYDVFDEQRYFEPALRQDLTVVNGQPVAITICEDAWNDKGFWPRQMYAVDPVDELMRRWEEQPVEVATQPRIILNISSSPYWQGKPAVREKMLAAIAERHNAMVVMANQVGGDDSLVFDGSSLAVAPGGKIIARAASFVEDLVVFETDGADAAKAVVKADDEVGELWSALVLGTRDYVRKCGFSKVLVGLSGGIDSALVAAIAVEALGAENVLGVGMPSEYSSLGSIDDAKKLAKNLGIRFELLPIHDVFSKYQHVLAPLFAGTPFGLAEENLQSRIRGALLMALSNKFGSLVLTTGNKSEMSVGYCTLYGDMVGALAVIGDVYKTEVYALSRYANREREIIPTATLTKPPSAELRPGQKDSDSLPLYEVLDPILKAYIEEYKSAQEIAEQRKVDEKLVKQVLRLVELSEYKRKQAAPVLKVSQKSFGMGRRFPIAAKSEV